MKYPKNYHLLLCLSIFFITATSYAEEQLQQRMIIINNAPDIAIGNGIIANEMVDMNNFEEDGDFSGQGHFRNNSRRPKNSKNKFNIKALTQNNDLILFFNHDRLAGHLKTIENHNLIWHHNDCKNNMKFPQKEIRYIGLTNKNRTIPNSTNNTIVKLINTDTIYGNIIEISQTNLTIDTWYAGQLTIPRKFIKTIDIGRIQDKSIYTGPNNIKNWKIQKGKKNSWTIKNHTLTNKRERSIIGTNVTLPDCSRIDFVASWENEVNFNFLFYTDKLNKFTCNSYLINVNYNQIYLKSNSSNGRTKQLLSMSNTKLGNTSSASFSIFTDKKNKRVTIMVNGKLSKTWQENSKSPFAGKGTSIMIHNGSYCKLEIKNIVISNWDGKLPKRAELNIQDKTETDIAILNTGAIINGSVITLKDKKLILQTPYGTLNIPQKRISSLTFKKDTTTKTIKTNNNEIIAYYRNKKLGHITLNNQLLTNNTFKINSPIFKNAEFKLEAFQLLKLNIHDKRHQTPIKATKNDW